MSWDDQPIGKDPEYYFTLVVTDIFEYSDIGECFILRGLYAKGPARFTGRGDRNVGTVLTNIEDYISIEEGVYNIDVDYGYGPGARILGKISDTSCLFAA